jgi:lipopolysaccharide transport system ATP-binding protein
MMKTIALPIPLLTGRENIVLRGLHRGLTKRDGRAMADEIAEFSGLGEFIDLPIRGYSAGMDVRLSFAMGTAITPEILLMDEWFLAGDANFMAKAEDRLTRLVTGVDTLVVASHDMGVVQKWCTRGNKLDAGRIVADGPVEEVLRTE